MEVAMTPAPCLSTSAVIISPMIRLFSLSRWLIGSSRKRKSNGWQSARIKATRCCCPKDSLPTFTLILSAIPNCSKYARTSFFFFISGKVVFQLYVFESGKFGKDAQVLKKSILNECFLKSTHCFTEYALIFVSSKLIIP